MKNTVLAAANFYSEKYYFNNEFASLPKQVQDEIKILCTLTANKLKCTFLLCFNASGDVFFETQISADDLQFDDINAEYEISFIRKKRSDLFTALSLYYKFFKQKP